VVPGSLRCETSEQPVAAPLWIRRQRVPLRTLGTTQDRVREQTLPHRARVLEEPRRKGGQIPNQRVRAELGEQLAPVLAEEALARLRARFVEAVRDIEEAIAPAVDAEDHSAVRIDAVEIPAQETALSLPLEEA